MIGGTLPPFEFENWAVIALGGIPNKAQVGDMGIDGRIFPVAAAPKKATARKGDTQVFGEFLDHWYPSWPSHVTNAAKPAVALRPGFSRPAVAPGFSRVASAPTSRLFLSRLPAGLSAAPTPSMKARYS